MVWVLITGAGLIRQHSLIDAVQYGYPKPWVTVDPDALTEYTCNWMHFAHDLAFLSLISVGVFAALEVVIAVIRRNSADRGPG
jgi:energy-converting hydrogenase Eha subunit E